MSLTAIVVIVVALFIHDSGATLVHGLRIAGKSLFLPLFLALVVSYILDPAVSSLERKGLKRSYGVLLIFGVLVFFLSGLTYFIFPLLVQELIQLRVEAPRYLRTLVDFLASFEIFYNKDFGIFGQLNLAEGLSSYLERSGGRVFSSFISAIWFSLSLLILVPLFSFFFLYDGRRLKRSFIQSVPNRYFESAMIVFYHVNKNLSNFIQGRFYESALVGLITLIGLYLIGLKYFWIFALLTALTNLVPVLGPLMNIILTCSFTFLVSNDLVLTIFVFVVLLFGQLVDNLILIPLLIKRTVNLHVITGLLAIIIGGKLFGVFGMILAIPVTAIGKLIFQEFWRHWRGHLTPAQAILPEEVGLNGMIG